jgi:hypothetical protein
MFFSSCEHNIQTSIKTVTLLYVGNRSANPKNLFADSIRFEYTQLDKYTQNVNRIFVSILGKRSMSYTLVKCGSLVYLKPLNETDKSIYINFKSTESTDLFFENPQVYLWGGLRFIKEGRLLNENNQYENFYILYGNDIGFFLSDSLYYYFDKDIHLRQISDKKGKIVFIDKRLIKCTKSY